MNHPFLMALARRVAKQRLVREQGMTPEQAAAAVDAVSAEEIAAAASATRVGALGDGEILRWLADNKDGLLVLVEVILKLALLFA